MYIGQKKGMENNYSNSKFKELLDKLQQESWQLELLISGFAIFGLFTAIEPLSIARQESVAAESYTKFLFVLASISCLVLIVNLIIHVVLRGLWIGAIGLRYVSGEIDYDSLNYRKRFTNYLKNKVGSFDKYIGNLENYCSILFAVTFLYLFYIISFFIVLLVILLAGNFFIESGIFSEFLGTMLLGFFGMFFLFLCFIVFIDFITQGYLKKKEWTSFLYFPLYKVFSILTLSFLYRPLVYNFLDNKFGRRILFILFPVYLSAFYLSTVSNVRSSFVFRSSISSENYTNSTNYLNTLEKGEFINNAAITSKIIEKPFLVVFIPFVKSIEDAVTDQDVSLKKVTDTRGFKSDFFFKKKLQFKDSLQTRYLNAFKKTYALQLDSTPVQTDFLISDINHQLGFETVLPLKSISEGKHLLKISRFTKPKPKFQKKPKDTIVSEKIITIPFWYYKQ